MGEADVQSFCPMSSTSAIRSRSSSEQNWDKHPSTGDLDFDQPKRHTPLFENLGNLAKSSASLLRLMRLPQRGVCLFFLFSFVTSICSRVRANDKSAGTKQSLRWSNLLSAEPTHDSY
jgi:hypothetical protein